MRQATSQNAENPVTLADVTTEISHRITALSETLREAAQHEGNPTKLKEILDTLRVGNHEVVREVMGAHFIGPEAYKKIFGAKDLGEIPPIPAHITKELLAQRCELTRDGRTKNTSTIAETHRLVFIPSTIDGDPFTIIRLCCLAELAAATLGRDGMFDDTSWYLNEPFANTIKDKGEWVLVPMTDLPNSRDKTYDEQNAELKKYPDYRGATALELVTTLIMNKLILQPRGRDIGVYYSKVGRCTDTSASGDRVYAGSFYPLGLSVSGDFDDRREPGLGLAVVRK